MGFDKYLYRDIVSTEIGDCERTIRKRLHINVAC